MFTIEEKIFGDVPCLHVFSEENRDKKLPTILFNHGFNGAKEHMLHYGYLLAKSGYRVVLPDANYHGERVRNLSQSELDMIFWQIVTEHIEDLKKIKEDLVDRGLTDETRIVMGGISMGAIVTLGALTQYDWIKVAVSLMGTPAYVQFFDMIIQSVKDTGMPFPFSEEVIQFERNRLAKFDLSLQPEKLNLRPLFLWHGDADSVVPFAGSKNLYEAILPMYKEVPERIQFIPEKNRDHVVSRSAVLAAVEWIKKFI